MADKLSILGSIHSSISPATTTSYPVTDIISGDRTIGWQYSQNNDILDYPIWAIIDLGDNKVVEEFKLYGTSYIWGGGSCPSNFVISVSSTGTDEDDFSFITSSILSTPIRVVSANTWTNSASIAIFPQLVRYIKIQINGTYDLNATTVGLSEVEIYGSDTFLEQNLLYSNSEFERDAIVTITSNGYIEAPSATTYTTISSDAVFDSNLILTYSDAEIIYLNTQLKSDAVILGPTSTSINSAATIQRTLLSFRGVFNPHPGQASLKNLRPEENYDKSLIIRGAFDQSLLDSTSLETIVPDMYTSTPMDIGDCITPYGYQKYDWSYDWTIKTFNNAKYIIEVRSGESEIELYANVFSPINKGHLMLPGNIPKYHQWRAHVWASGSGDFELHQFTIKCHAERPISFYRGALIEKPFTTTSNLLGGFTTIPKESDIIVGTPPVTTTAQILIPYENAFMGDLNGDNRVDTEDITILMNYIWNGAFLTEQQKILASVAGPLAGDRPCPQDLSYLIAYINGGPPPISPDSYSNNYDPPVPVDLTPIYYGDILLGDLNIDGHITEEDSDLLLNAIYGDGTLTEAQKTASIVAGPLGVAIRPNSTDYVYLTNYIAGGPVPKIPATLTEVNYATGIMGDLNGDGKVDYADAELLSKHLLNESTLTINQQLLAMVSGESNLPIARPSVFDLIYLINYIEGGAIPIELTSWDYPDPGSLVYVYHNGLLLGDVNGDGKIDQNDVDMVTDAIYNGLVLSPAQKFAATVAGDVGNPNTSRPTIFDLTYLTEYIFYEGPPPIRPADLELIYYNGYIMGDLNNDGMVNYDDVLLLQDYIFGLGTLTALQKSLAVVSGGPWPRDPSISDLTYLMSYIFIGGDAPIAPENEGEAY